MNRENADCAIFINYRQRDSSNSLRNHAILVEALSHRLAGHFGEHAVFVDTSMRSGTRYPEALRAKLTTCHVLLAVIHPEWLEDLHQRRNRQEPDWVLDEISTAFNGDPHAEDHTAQHPVVIPVLLESAELPQAGELPEKIRTLADLEPLHLRSGSLDGNFTCLAERLEKHVPASWEASSDSEPKNSEQLLPAITLAAGAIILFLLSSTDYGLAERSLTLATISLIMMAFLLLFTAGAWVLGWTFHRLDQQFQAQPARQFFLTGGVSLIGAILLVFYPIVSTFIEDEESLATTASRAITILTGSSVALLLVMSLAAQGSREDVEWPPRVPIRRVPAWEGLLRRAVVRLEKHLTSSWRPPLSRARRDQAQYLARQLSTAAAALRREIELSRLDWLRTAHPRLALTYLIWLVGTISLAVTSMYLLIGREHTSAFIYLSIVTLIVALGLCFGTMELWFRHQRRQRNWLVTEIEKSLSDRLLPYLPPHMCDS